MSKEINDASEDLEGLIDACYKLDIQLSNFVKHHGALLKSHRVYWYPVSVRAGIQNIKVKFQEVHQDLWTEKQMEDKQCR